MYFFFSVHMTCLSSQWYDLRETNIIKDPFIVWLGVLVDSY